MNEGRLDVCGLGGFEETVNSYLKREQLGGGSYAMAGVARFVTDILYVAAEVAELHLHREQLLSPMATQADKARARFEEMTQVRVRLLVIIEPEERCVSHRLIFAFV